jgi:pimeloyl-ACP methyl ester carboxylesterase/DNA-binding winged helix-turn-helix (wHTH) protein
LFSFDDFSLDPDRRELKRGGTAIAVEPQVFDLLVHLIENRHRVVSRDDLIASVWSGRIVSESTIASRINAARQALGDSGDAQRLIKTIPRKGFRFVGEMKQPAAAPGVTNSGGHAIAAIPPRQKIQFCTASDGVRIAYADVGQGPLLVKTGNWLNHLEYDWQSPVWRPFFRAMTDRYRLIRYDARGNGLSDWNVDDISFEAFVRDLESVVEATGIERFALYGMSQGCAVSVAYAVRYPERVSHLILYGGLVRGRRRRGPVEELQQSDALLTLMRQGWGQDNPAFRQMFTSLFIPGGSPEQIDWYNDLQRVTTSPEIAARLRHAMDDIDISDLLPRVRVPTLVMHLRDDAVAPFEQGRQLAAGIKDARFVVLEGRNHVILESDPGWQRFHDEIADFVSAAT